MSLIRFTPNGLYCPVADVYLDPWKPVRKAIITHAHSDHARPGNSYYLAHHRSAAILRMRLGTDIQLETVEYNQPFIINNVKFSLHPAGHIIGSAQIRIEYQDELWVFSGDYKCEDDGVCEPFEPFITESTFGLPVYRWTKQADVIQDIKEWWQENRMNNKGSILMGYALGKMQRLIKNLYPFDGPVYAHGAIYNVNEKLRDDGADLPHILPAASVTDKNSFRQALILAPASALNSRWLKRFEPYSTAYCSGWMAIRGAKNRKAVDRGFVLSDHADWTGLNNTVKATGAEKVFVTHGYTSAFSKWLNEYGIESAEVKTMYGEADETELIGMGEQL
jgi:putative mRNA 3-end processing factor